MLFGRKILVTDADKQECEGRAPLRALFANCTLKSGDAPSHTEALFDAAVAPHLQEAGVGVSRLRIADLRLDPTTDPDHDQDDGPELVERVLGADILVIGTPLWLGRESSLAVRLMERLYAISGRTNDAGQSIFYNRVASVLVTGNEDGAKAASAQLLYGLQHLGFVIPPQADAYWVGEARPGPSFGDDGAGEDNDFTSTSARIMSANLIQFTQRLRQSPIVPEGNVRETA